MSDLIEAIKKHEGFRAKPYPDPIRGWDVPTFGHGLTYITPEESEVIIHNRVTSIRSELSRLKPVFGTLSAVRQDALIEMAYQMGVYGLVGSETLGIRGFKDMWAAIEQGNYSQARLEALDSRWAKQTPNRAKAVADKLV